MSRAWVLTVAALLACSAGPSEQGRVLLIGIDGATLRVMEPLLAAGRLPNLAAIAGAGAYGPLRSTPPLLSPAIWTSIATGKARAKHGIDTFVREDNRGERRLYQSSDRRSHALWNIASDAGLQVGVINWWVTYPVETVHGVMVSDHAIPGQRKARAQQHGAQTREEGDVVYPAAWQTAIQPLLADNSPLEGLPDPFPGAQETDGFLWQSIVRAIPGTDSRVVRIAVAVEQALRPDVMMVFLKGIDPVSHTLFGYLEPESLPEAVRERPEGLAAGAEALRQYYEYTDALIGRLTDRFGPDDLVLVVSDHGFEAGPTASNRMLTGKHDSAEASDGVVFARGRGIAPGSKADSATIYDIAPTILAWLDLPVGDDMDGQVAGFLDAGPTKRVATHDTGRVERGQARDSGSEETILEGLRALGYIE